MVTTKIKSVVENLFIFDDFTPHMTRDSFAHDPKALTLKVKVPDPVTLQGMRKPWEPVESLVNITASRKSNLWSAGTRGPATGGCLYRKVIIPARYITIV